ncbi:MAG: hypothetical protein KDA32_03185 [Phycisphaerales bacterium]|nr:hypothetical protein [Phycisphaerales bacterium]
MHRPPDPFSGLWLTPVIFGTTLILLGWLVVAVPSLRYLFAGMLILAGIIAIGVGLRLRRSTRVVIRRIDEV